MDYKKSYTLLWVGLIAGFVLMLIGVFLESGLRKSDLTHRICPPSP